MRNSSPFPTPYHEHIQNFPPLFHDFFPLTSRAGSANCVEFVEYFTQKRA